MAHSAAKYDRRIGFERFDSDQRNAFNEPIGAWVLAGQTFAQRMDVRDSEKLQAGREASALVARFVVRSTALTRFVTPGDRLVLRGTWDQAGQRQSGEVWDIDGVKEVPGATHHELEFTAVWNRETNI